MPVVSHTSTSRLALPTAQENAHFAGWIEAAALEPPLHRLFGRVMSARGWNSPRTKVGPDELVALTRAHSPGRANQLAWKIRRRANAILSPYGLKVANATVFRALVLGGTRVGKLATGRPRKPPAVSSAATRSSSRTWSGAGCRSSPG